jgi:undecaprenyl-phosphate galactose phosphotransferase/putative colanic acid biosynthesis UDP-glucose lipid carrier transferase
MLLNEMIRRSAPSGALGMTRAVVVGDPEELASLSQRDLRQHYGIEQVARFAFRGSSVDPRLVVGIIEAIRMHRAEQVIVVLPWHDRRRIDMLIDQMRALPTPIVLIADSRTRAIALEARAGERPAFTVELQKAPLTRTEAAVKRLFDIVASAAILWLLLPVFLLIAISVRVESAGPVVFRQRRHGFNGAEFKIRKFRTMRVLEDGPTIVQTRANDLRVTRVGRILRRSSLDELPQLMNVLVGDMSLIGPRPHAVAHDRQFSALVSNYASRFRIKPGMTGWAQINGFRGETPQIGLMQKRIDLDLWYIDNWSLWLDLKILVLTFREVLRGRHAF